MLNDIFGVFISHIFLNRNIFQSNKLEFVTVKVFV